MAQFVFKLPDLGEGTVDSEIVEWRVSPGDRIEAEQPLVDMMTDKATVEITSPVTGRVVSLAGKPGDRIAVGSALVVFETGEQAQEEPARASGEFPGAESLAPAPAPVAAPSAPAQDVPRKVRTSPAVRRMAREAGVDLREIEGTGPEGRIRKQDLDAHLGRKPEPAAPATPAAPAAARPAAREGTEEIPVIGLRRRIAEKMAESKRRIPHFSYVEEVDLTELESLRRHLNEKGGGKPKLTYLPFLALALVRVLRDFPQCNAHFDDERMVITRHRAVHLGIATQTPGGLMVPVVKHAETLDLYGCAAEIARVAEAARSGKATREELGGSTITITSLGALGGIVSTPVINHPEVAIIGVNKAVERPVIYQGAIAVRLMMNLSSSFDHRFIDGYDAAEMIQALKERLEHPATIFI